MEKSIIQVILADDHSVVRAGIRQFLEQPGDIKVIAEADNGESAKELIEKHQPDVVVLDIQMPGASGIEVTRWVRAHHPEIGILVLTAYDDDPYVIAVLKAGANGYVLKTATPMEITQAVREVNEGRSVLDPTVVGKVMTQLYHREAVAEYESLTDRELEVLTWVAKGLTNKGIGVQLGISARTVQGHLAHIYAKLQVASRTEAVMRGISLGLLPKNISLNEG
ncbi:MAG: response regulator transcription factor [Anaerolineaceae bacterium]|nr:response regulator transcription factor [Anaerolineaceae bacterium]